MHSPVARFSERQEKVLRPLLALRSSFRRGEVSADWVVVSVCTALETACSDLLDDLLRTQASRTQSQLERAMIKAQRSEMKGSWRSRLQWLSVGFSKNLDAGTACRLSAMIELRNAIAHDGSAFTPRQVEKYSEFLRQRHVLESEFDVIFNGTRFTVGERTGDNALDVGREVTIQLL